MTTDILVIESTNLLQEQVEVLVVLETKSSHEVVETAKNPEVVEVRTVEAVTEIQQEFVVVTEGIQGPPGIPGPAGGQVLQRTAGMDTSALLVVYEDLNGAVWPADPDVERDVLALLGVTVSAAAGGQPINVQRLGHIDDAAWQLQPGKRVFLGRQGRLTQEPPKAGYDVLIGMALTASRLLLNFQDPIELE
ncbi:hypothetical protein [Comamonas sp. lk]|uniref:hypothetical protein n=1 Tax=Comamonas sp. lk TaxID=2201272 RepID=UPI001F09EB42|nr:hypothetical protein [Comamonas sp. lk]